MHRIQPCGGRCGEGMEGVDEVGKGMCGHKCTIISSNSIALVDTEKMIQIK